MIAAKRPILAFALALFVFPGTVLGQPGTSDQTPDEVAKRIASLQAKYEAELAQLQKEKAELQDQLRQVVQELQLKVKKLEEKIRPIDLVAHEQPKGRIIAVENGQKSVHLNLGSADFVKVGLSFSVFGDLEYKPSADSKACIEVVEITGEHRCRARVTQIKNAVRQPIVVGDQLYNPAWTPGLRDHVAIVGAIDLNGDGRDGTAAFVKALEKQGVIVDVWIDMKEPALKGDLKAVNLKTSYLIMGDLPELEGGPMQDTLVIMHELANKVIDRARANAVCFVSARRYLALMGMQVPKPAATSGESSMP